MVHDSPINVIYHLSTWSYTRHSHDHVWYKPSTIGIIIIWMYTFVFLWIRQITVLCLAAPSRHQNIRIRKRVENIFLDHPNWEECTRSLLAGSITVADIFMALHWLHYFHTDTAVCRHYRLRMTFFNTFFSHFFFSLLHGECIDWPFSHHFVLHSDHHMKTQTR